MSVQDLEYDNKIKLIKKIQDLLAKVESSPRAEKYQYVIQIYDYLGSNKKFVINNQVFYKILKENANTLIKDMVQKLVNRTCTSSELVSCSQAILSIINCIKIIDSDS
jgi:hypothetical protein